LRRGALTKPINLGAPINTSFDDFSLTYHNKTQGFFASNRKKGGDDIFSFTQIGDIFPKEYIARFEVRDFASDGYVKDPDVVLYNTNNEVVYESQLDSVGAFELKVFPGKYNFKAKANGYRTKTQPIKVKEKENGIYIIYLDREVKEKDEIVSTENSNNSSTNKDTESNTVTNKVNVTDIITETDKTKETEIAKVKLKETLLTDTKGPPVIEKEGKLYFKMPPIYFDYDKWNIRADSKKVLDELAQKMEKYKTVYIKISSHTDSRGTDTYNQTLSEKRAESTRNYLALEGYVNARRMKFVGFGESVPLIDCDSKSCTEEEHQTNRRSEFEIVKY